MNTQEEISLVHLLVRYWRLIAGTACASIGIAGLLTIVMPHRYESRMKFLVNNKRADLVITPEKNPGYLARNEVTETQVNSEIELLKSCDILENVVNDNKLYQPYERNKKSVPSRLAMEKATVRLQKDLGVAALRKTDIV